MSAPNSTNKAIIKQEPISISKKPNLIKQTISNEKKHVKIKSEPVLIPLIRSKLPTSSSSSKKSSKHPSYSSIVPSTPVTKIIDQPSIKQIDNQVRNSVVDKSAKFFLNTNENNDELTFKGLDGGTDEKKVHGVVNSIMDPSSSVEEITETPTRKRAKSQDIKNNGISKDGKPVQQLAQEKKKVKLDLINGSSTPINSKIPRKSVNETDTKMSPILYPKSSKGNTVKSPAAFKNVSTQLIENKSSEFESIDEIFRSVEDSKIKAQYLATAKLPFEEWASKGFAIANKQAHLVKRVVLVRSELNYKFDVILNIVNKYGQSLEEKDLELNDKMMQLQKLGEDIKRFIN